MKTIDTIMKFYLIIFKVVYFILAFVTFKAYLYNETNLFDTCFTMFFFMSILLVFIQKLDTK